MTVNQELILRYETEKGELHEAITRVLASGRYILGSEVASFEKEYAGYLGVRHAVGVASGTDGLMLALMSLGIRRGDEVITSPYTALPTISAIHATGARPVFVDVDADTFLIDIDRIASVITRKTRAVIPVHLFGNVVDCRKIRDRFGSSVAIIEDACQSHGSTLDGYQAGALGDIGVFSFYPTKNLGGCGDGGMVVTGNDDIHLALRLLRNHGSIDGNNASIPGINSRLDELQAAILRVRLRGLDNANRKRAGIAEAYRHNLKKDLFDFQAIPGNVQSNYHVCAARFKGERDRFHNYLVMKGISSRVYYPVPVYLQRAYAYLGIARGEFPVTERLCYQVIALPTFPGMDESTLDRIIDTINSYGG